MSDYDNTDSGLIYRNYRREEGSRQPEFTGSINVNGVEYWVSGWKKQTKEGTKLYEAGVDNFISLAVKPKEEAQSSRGGRGGSASRERAPARQERAPARQPAPAPAPRGGSGFDDMDDDIPF